jgi:protocatechuate 3,4-dioxygenase beta subunit
MTSARPPAGLAMGAALLILSSSLQAVTFPLPFAGQREAPSGAPASAAMTPAGEPGPALHVSGVVVDAQGRPVADASLYAYQTDAEGYYGVKPASDSRNPRLKVLLRSDAQGRWSFTTIRPGSYPNSRAPGHIHFEVTATGFAAKIFEIVFEGDPLVTAAMRQNPMFSVRPVDAQGRVTERIVLEKKPGVVSH